MQTTEVPCRGAWGSDRVSAPVVTLSDVFARLAAALDADNAGAPLGHGHVRQLRRAHRRATLA